jgi:TetR/AcrR family transcriptional regulator
MNNEIGLTHRRILDATLATLAKHKISGTRMRLIAKKAGMSQGNLHYYFPKKADLYMALIDDMLDHFVHARVHALEDKELGPEKKLAIFFDQMKNILLSESHRMFVFYDFWVQGTSDRQIRSKIQHMYATWRSDIAAVVQQGVREETFDQAQADIIPHVMVSLMEGAALQHLIDEQAVDLDDYFARAQETVFSMLNELGSTCGHSHRRGLRGGDHDRRGDGSHSRGNERELIGESGRRVDFRRFDRYPLFAEKDSMGCGTESRALGSNRRGAGYCRRRGDRIRNPAHRRRCGKYGACLRANRTGGGDRCGWHRQL